MFSISLPPLLFKSHREETLISQVSQRETFISQVSQRRNLSVARYGQVQVSHEGCLHPWPKGHGGVAGPFEQQDEQEKQRG